MVSKGRFLNFANVAIGFLPIDLGLGDTTGDWINLKNYDRVAVILISKGAASSGADFLKVTIQQGVTSTGNSVKGLNIDKVWSKESSASLRGSEAGTWTESTKTLGGIGTTGSTFKGSTGTAAKKASIHVIDIGSESLDVDNSFDWIRVKVADPGVTSQNGVLLYVPYNAKYPNKPANMESVIKA